MMRFASIETAPQDGTVILTDCGTAMYVDQKNWGSPVTSGWYLCGVGCSIPTNDVIEPKLWMPVPRPEDDEKKPVEDPSLYKTTIVIWSEFDPSSDYELDDLTREAMNGTAYCSSQETVRVEKPKLDPDWDGTEFFGGSLD